MAKPGKHKKRRLHPRKNNRNPSLQKRGPKPKHTPKPRLRPFESKYTTGLRGDWVFRASLPLAHKQFEKLITQRVNPVLQRMGDNHRYYITFLILVEGQIYELSFLPSDDDEMTLQWFSTKATKDPTEVPQRIVDVLQRIMDALEERPGWIRRVAVTIYEHKKRE